MDQDDLNKDFYKALLKNDKGVFHISEIAFINVPKCPEISVKVIAEMVKDDEETMFYLPSNITKKKGVKREPFFNIVNTVNPGYLSAIVKHAQD